MNLNKEKSQKKIRTKILISLSHSLYFSIDPMNTGNHTDIVFKPFPASLSKRKREKDQRKE